MARRRRAEKREVFADPKYNDLVTSKFINVLMLRGKRAVAEAIVYGSFGVIESRGKGDPLRVFHTAISNVKPSLEVRSRRVGGATYQVPMELRPERADALAYRWLIAAARSRAGRGMALQLADELLEASEGRGAAVKKRDDVHKMSEANRAFAHYRW